MKKYTFIIALLLGTSNFSQAQSVVPNDGMRYSDNSLSGTARYNAMGGAFGAVGGDLSAIGVNPAGSSFFNYNTASVSLRYADNQNKSTYLGNKENRNSSLFDLNQAGMVFVFSNPQATLNKFAFAINYESKQNFKNRYAFNGNNSYSDVSDYFLEYANGTNGIGVFPIEYVSYKFSDFGNFADQQAWLGYNSYILDYDNTSGQYYSNIPNGNGLNYFQRKQVTQRGYNSNLKLNFSAAIKDKLFLGINLNPYFTDYEKSFTVIENNNGVYPTGVTVNEVAFDNYIYTTGGGFNLDLGAIYKITDAFRIGASYNSPTWYRLTDEIKQGIYTVRTEDTNPNKYLGEAIYPNTSTVFESYNFRTAGKFTGSFAGIVNKRWLISGDVTVSDYSKMKYGSNGFEGVNNYYKQNLETAFEYRVGTEYVLGNVALRAGYRYIESPYKNNVYAPNGDTSSITAGIGFNFGKNKLDLSYAYTDRNFSEEFITSSYANSATVKNINNAVSLTYTVSF
jgi:hypothetical protein